MISAGMLVTLGLKTDGKAHAAGNDVDDQVTDALTWTGLSAIQQHSFGHNFYGIKNDGSVVSAGSNRSGERTGVSGWTDIIQIAAGGTQYEGFVIGLKSDGTVVHSGYDFYGQDAVTAWTDIVQISAGFGHCLGLKSDGTVVAEGLNGNNQVTNARSWTGITQLSAGYYSSMGLKGDGTVVTAGLDSNGMLSDSSSWTDIVQVSAGFRHSVGLKADGTAVYGGYIYDAYDVPSWADLIQVSAGYQYTVGLKSDGSAVATGYDNYGENYDVDGIWTGLNTTLPWVETDEPDPVIEIIPSVPCRFLLTLTGTADGTTDVVLPMTSLTARLRSGQVSYLQCTIPYTDVNADAVSARPNGDLQLVYVDADGSHDVVDVALEQPQHSEGTSTSSIVLTGHRQSTNASPGSHTLSANSRQSGTTSTISMPGYRPEILPADDVTSGGVTITANLVTLSASVSNGTINIQTVYSEGS